MSTIANDRIVVLGQRAHAIPVERYASAIGERLPEYDVVTAATAADERRLLPDASIATGLRIDASLLSRAAQLRLFACGSAGIGHLPMDALAERDVAVTNASGVHGPNIAEHVIGWILMFARRLDEGMRRKQRGVWQHFQAHELRGSTVTVVGLGPIGESIVERLEPFGVDTIGVRYTPEKGGPTDEVIGFDEDDVEDALVRTDYLVLACPLTDTTRGLVGSAEFATLDPNSVIVNVSRGPVVDSDALVAALRTDTIGGAALDVTDPEPLPSDHPLWGLEDCLITPHVGGSTPEHWPRMADLLAQNVRALVEGSGSLKNRV